MPSNRPDQQTMMTDKLSSDVRITINLLTSLEDFLYNFNKELDNCSSELPKYLLDWDVIQMFAEFRLSKSVFSFSINNAFEKLYNKKLFRVIVPQGTRKEFFNYVNVKLPKVLKVNSLQESSIEKEEKKGVYMDSKYEHCRKLFLSMHNISEIASLLNKFCEDYALSIESLDNGKFDSLSFSEIKKTGHFKINLERINKKRPYAKKRNEADAANISIIELAKECGNNYQLVTGTKMLKELFPGHVIDPISFLFKINFYEAYPEQVNQAKVKVENMKVRVQVISKRLKTIERGFFRTHQIPKKNARAWITDLRNLENDSVIGGTIRLIAAAELDAKNRYSSLSKKEIANIIVPETTGLNNFRKELCRLSNTLTNFSEVDPINELNFKWVVKKENEELSHHELLTNEKHSIFELYGTQFYVSVTWATSSSFIEVFDQINKLLRKKKVKKTANAVIKLYYNNKPAVDVGFSKRSFLKAISKRPKRIYFDGFRVLCDGIQFVYSTTNARDQLKPQLSIISDWQMIEIIPLYFKNTFIDFIPPNEIKKKLLKVKDLHVKTN